MVQVVRVSPSAQVPALALDPAQQEQASVLRWDDEPEKTDTSPVCPIPWVLPVMRVFSQLEGSLQATPPPSWLPLVDKVIRHADFLFDTHLTHSEVEEVVEVSFRQWMRCSVQ